MGGGGPGLVRVFFAGLGVRGGVGVRAGRFAGTRGEIRAARPRHVHRCDRDACHLDLQQAGADLRDRRARWDRCRDPPVPIVLREPEVTGVVAVSGLDDQIEDEIAHREVGRADTENFAARYLFEPVLRPAELVLDLIGGQLVQVPMEIRMTGDLVSVVHDPPHDRGVAFRDPPKDEERRSGLGGCEDIQELVNVRFEPRLQPIPIMRGEARPDVLGVEPVLDVEGRTEPLLLDRGNGCILQPRLHASSFRPRDVCSALVPREA